MRKYLLAFAALFVFGLCFTGTADAGRICGCGWRRCAPIYRTYRCAPVYRGWGVRNCGYRYTTCGYRTCNYSACSSCNTCATTCNTSATISCNSGCATTSCGTCSSTIVYSGSCTPCVRTYSYRSCGYGYGGYSYAAPACYSRAYVYPTYSYSYGYPSYSYYAAYPVGYCY
ncbi:MAG: hypothetical protein R3C18_12955 [Planctomycetaceae bacterium]